MSIRKAYDINNMMVKYKKYSGDDLTFTQSCRYNPDGQRITKKVSVNEDPAVRTDYFYDRGNVLYTTDGSSLKSQNLLNREGNVISSSRFENNTFKYYCYSKDVRNSTSTITDDANTAKAVYSYSDYGETEVAGDSNFKNEVYYTGGIHDSETGEYYLNARYYDPAGVRFTTMDTYRGEFEEPLSLNLYSYCLENPVNYVDPTGHESRKRHVKYKTQAVYMAVYVYAEGVYKGDIILSLTLKYKIDYKYLKLKKFKLGKLIDNPDWVSVSHSYRIKRKFTNKTKVNIGGKTKFKIKYEPYPGAAVKISTIKLALYVYAKQFYRNVVEVVETKKIKG